MEINGKIRNMRGREKVAVFATALMLAFTGCDNLGTPVVPKAGKTPGRVSTTPIPEISSGTISYGTIGVVELRNFSKFLRLEFSPEFADVSLADNSKRIKISAFDLPDINPVTLDCEIIKVISQPSGDVEINIALGALVEKAGKIESEPSMDNYDPNKDFEDKIGKLLSDELVKVLNQISVKPFLPGKESPLVTVKIYNGNK